MRNSAATLCPLFPELFDLAANRHVIRERSHAGTRLKLRDNRHPTSLDGTLGAHPDEVNPGSSRGAGIAGAVPDQAVGAGREFAAPGQRADQLTRHVVDPDRDPLGSWKFETNGGCGVRGIGMGSVHCEGV